jgi:hypothetical protein
MIVVSDTSPLTASLTVGEAGVYLSESIKEAALKTVGE